jgi:hypothetical protein
MAYDKLSIINDALILTSNNPVGVESDGSSEWIVGSNAYESELPLLISKHNWGFAETTATLQRTGASADPRFTDAYAKPSDALFVEFLWLASNGSPVQFDVLDNKILCSASTEAPVAKYLRRPGTITQWPEGFVETLRMRIMAKIYRGLNEDFGQANTMLQLAEAELAQARVRSDQEGTPRAMLVSKMARARKIRRGGLQ